MVMDFQEVQSLNKTIYVAPFLAMGLSGDATWGQPVPVQARVEPNNQLLRTTTQGEALTMTWQVITQYLIGLSDRVWLPHGPNPAQPTDPTVAHEPKQVNVLYDDDGTVHHYEVLF